jgi:hypothetical protein
MAHLRALRQEAPEARFAVSRLSWLECMVKPMRDNDQALMSEYRAFFEAGAWTMVGLTVPAVELATTLRDQDGLKTPDALQAASALQFGGETVFVTNDTRFGQRLGPESRFRRDEVSLTTFAGVRHMKHRAMQIVADHS